MNVKKASKYQEYLFVTAFLIPSVISFNQQLIKFSLHFELWEENKKQQILLSQCNYPML